MLNLLDSFKFLKGFPLAKYYVVTSEKELDLPFPYYLKATSVLHKTEQKAVLKCSNLEDAKKNLKDLKKRFPDSEILLQESEEGMEMILGLKEDRVFGKILLVGFGGIHTEVLKDVSFRALPVSKSEIEAMIKELNLFPSLVTRKKYSLDKFISLAEKVSKLNARELDLNPVMLNEKEAVIVDARILL